MQERRDYNTNGRGRRDYDTNFADICLHCDLRQEVFGMKKVFLAGVGAMVTIFIAAFGYFAHNQDVTQELVLGQTKLVVEINTVQKHKILPALKGLESDAQIDARRRTGYPGHDKAP